MEKICVAVRMRPPKEDPESSNSINGTFWKVEHNRISLHRPLGTPISGLSHAFDHVFDESSNNAMVYVLLTKDVIHAAVNGFNGTVFAYGQTSSGKTFTMNGSPTDPGIIHRAVNDIFDKIETILDREFLIRVSYMEIYNEEINDLFAVESQKLQIHESLERGVFVSGLREEIVNNAEQVMKFLELGEANRHFGETNMNVRSSRSHTIFRMVIESKRKETDTFEDHSIDDAIRVSVLNLVDLAGSERIAKTGADGVRLKEGKHINKSLMVLGNVINKLSEGGKQRGHVPYRDSKLTRILQPALGGNAKTSIVCTVAPEEIHVEETKGTLQFASRAKRVTNCVQVNEILTDAALLKRQKLEIEELRKKLEGSHAEVLEQQILKLRNEMLKYELERGKLETELEAERRLQKEREQRMREQQMKIENLSSHVTLSDCDRSSSQGQDSVKPIIKEKFSSSNNRCQGDLFSTPCFRAAPNAFVAKRSNYSELPDCSPLPDSFTNVADEDTWLQMNKGYVADLYSIHMTPSRRFQYFPPSDPALNCSNESNKQEFQELKLQLELVTKEKNEFERKHMEQLQLNQQLIAEVSVLKQQMLPIQEIPRMFSDSLASCKNVFRGVISTAQGLESDADSSTAKLSCTAEIGASIFQFLETHFSAAFEEYGSIPRNDRGMDPQTEDHGKELCERLKTTMKSMVLPETPMVEDRKEKISSLPPKNKGCTVGEEISSWKENLSDDLDGIKENYTGMQKVFDHNDQLLESSRAKYDDLQRQFQLLKEERDSLHRTVSESSQKLVQVNDQNKNVLKELNTELQRRKHLEEEFKQFSVAFANRQRSLTSFHNGFKSKVDSLRSQSPVKIPKSLGS